MGTLANRPLASIIAAFTFIMVLAWGGTKVSAVSGSDFQAGRIIDDPVFYGSSAGMNASEIQNFLNARVPACDTNGSQPSGHGSYSRAEWGTINGAPPPYTCLRDYRQDTLNKPAENGLCNGHVAGNKSAAQIIHEVAQSCAINPKVLIVLLQKEQSLVTDNWPWPIQYRSATGYGCPDTAPCDAEYYGFFNQVYNAARQFKRYAQSPHVFNYQFGRNNNIPWHPNGGCGASTVYIENQATASLYNYTPYRPNQAALNNLYGTGDGCSSYGNRNFWRMFSDWFGTTRTSSPSGCAQATNTSLACVWQMRNFVTNEQIQTASYDELNGILAGGNHAYIGINFFGNASWAIQPGNIPVYKLTKPNGATFLTTSATERDVLVGSHGFSYQGVGFNANPSWSNAGYPVHRLYSSSTGRHVWTANAAEKDSLVGSQGFSSEGVAFVSVPLVWQEMSAPNGKFNLYRFYIPETNSHFWTTDIGERDNLIWHGYQYERVAWYVSASTADTPVYRLYAPALRQHLYTTDAHERDVLSSYHGWWYEGISYYVNSSGAPIYRLYAPSLGVHHLTLDAHERAVLLGSGNWHDEGVAWYQN